MFYIRSVRLRECLRVLTREVGRIDFIDVFLNVVRELIQSAINGSFREVTKVVGEKTGRNDAEPARGLETCTTSAWDQGNPQFIGVFQFSSTAFGFLIFGCQEETNGRTVLHGCCHPLKKKKNKEHHHLLLKQTV